jgi:probable F420-dependent oxidoreductase
MRFMVDYPIQSDPEGGAWIDPDNIARFAQAAERAGCSALSFTDHPAPSRKWLAQGGHETFDPFVALGYVAGVTKTLRLMTYLTVIPYRNPFLSAKSMASVDVLSGGRSIFVLGTGYLRSEFAALGVDFEERNAIFDEALLVMREAWTADEVRHEGTHFRAYGVTHTPKPVQKPHPPLWLGGNAAVVRRRVAEWAQGWAPLLGGPELLQTARTRSISGLDELAALIAGVRDDCAAAGRDPSLLDFVSGNPEPLPDGASDEQRIDATGRLAEIGVTWTSLPVPRASFEAAIDGIEAAAAFIAAVG